MSALNYTSTGGDPLLDAAFEAALATARRGRHEPLAHLIGGKWKHDGELLFERADPCDPSRIVSRAYWANGVDVRFACMAARRAQPGWAATPLGERVAALRRLAALIGQRRTEIAGVVSAETGKVRMEAIPEVQEGVDLIETYCAEMERRDGYRIPLGRLSDDEHNVSVMRPYGVFGVISPFNFPFALAVNMTAGALVCGNTVVLKPAEETPWSTGLIGELATEAGLPPGVLNIVHGDDEVGRDLVAEEIDGVAFTGSAEAGHEIARAVHATRPLRPLILEMGGKNPAIVTHSADLDRAAEGIVRSAYGLSGQKCSSCSRVVMPWTMGVDDLLERIEAHARELVVGDPADRATSLGPVVSAQAVARFEAAVADARRDGRIWFGGERVGETGWFVAPTLALVPGDNHRLAREELFVPFLTVTGTGSSIEDLVKEANAVEYGLTAGIFSEDEDEVETFLEHIEAGVVYVNRRQGATTGAWPGIQSFCGWKGSGMSGKGGLGPHYLPQFMREQSRTVMAI